jgi:glycosyltransferase involved in cell wall biosynthesis
MRIAHVITRLILGGAQENTITSVLGLRGKPGLELSLISGPTHGPEGTLEPMLAERAMPVTIVPSLIRAPHPWHDWLAWRSLVRLFRVQRPDVVHTHSGKAGILGRLAAARAAVPRIIHTIHGPSFGEFQNSLANISFRSAERFAARFTDHFVVVAEAMKEQYLAAGIGQPDQYTKLYSGFDLRPFLSAHNDPALRTRFGLRAEDVVVGKIARLCKLKGHDDLLTVAPALVRAWPQFKFLLVGDGPWRGRFEARVRALHLERHFVFTGLVPPEAVASMIGIMDVLVHLSAREGLARALPQALAAGRPVVAYDCDGAKEVCLDNQTGFLIKRGDLDGLAGCLKRLAMDPQLGKRLGLRGQQFVRDRFDAGQMVEALFQLYLRLT